MRLAYLVAREILSTCEVARKDKPLLLAIRTASQYATIRGVGCRGVASAALFGAECGVPARVLEEPRFLVIGRIAGEHGSGITALDPVELLLAVEA